MDSRQTSLTLISHGGFSMEMLYYVLCVIVLGRLTYHLTRSYIKYQADTAFGNRHGCQPPPELPNRWPLGIDRIKELWDANAEGKLLAFLCMVAKDYEPRNNLSQYLLFGPRAFHVLHPANVKCILSTNFNDYGVGARPDVVSPLLGNGILAQEGLAWKHSRDILQRQLMGNKYQNNPDLFREHVDNLISHLPVDGYTTTALLFGKSIYSLRGNVDRNIDNKIFSESFDIAQDGLSKRFRIAPWHFLYRPREFRRACSNVHRFIEHYIEDMDKTSYSSFITQVARYSTTKNDLRDQLLNLLLAGRDTTACCLSWTIRLLVRHQSVIDRLQREIDGVMGDLEHPTREQIKRMPYLACVIKESLRLYPPAPLNSRQAIRTTILPTGGGPDGKSPILVRAGEVVVFSQYVNSRKQNIYGPDAEAFRPEKWEGEALANIGWAYFPFNGGPRQCLGKDFALMEVSYTIVRLLKSSFIALPPGVEAEPIGSERQRLTLVLSSADGCRVSVKKRPGSEC